MWKSVAVVLYLLPIVGFLAYRRIRRDDALGRALDVPVAVGADLLFILLTARFVLLDYAVLIARVTELLVVVWLFVRRRSELELPSRSAVLRTFTGAPLWSALLSVVVSRSISVPYAIWDRHWHMPLVASMRGQRAPFENVYEPGAHFFYHYAGNALAAIFQGLSFAHLHASATLSLSHDVMFGAFGLFLALALRAFGVRHSAVVFGTVFLILTTGPATVLYEGLQRWGTGRSLTSSLSLSFRPHEPLSFLFGATFLVAGLAPIMLKLGGARRVAVALPIAASVLSLSDEPTLALLMGTLGVAWVLAPREVAGDFRARLFPLLAPAAATLLTLLLLGGTFSPGAPKQSIELVHPRMPGFYLTSLPLPSTEGFAALGGDFLGPLAVAIAALISALALPNARGLVLLVAHWAFLVASLSILVFVKVNHDDIESHRSATGLMLLSPLLLGWWFARLPHGGARAWVLGIGGVACLFGSASSVEWIRGVAGPESRRLKPYWGDDMFYQTDCVSDAGARLGERAMPSIGPQERWYLFAGCRPVYVPPGGTPGGHAIAVGWPDVNASVLDKVEAWLPRFERVRIFVPRAAAAPGSFDSELRPRGACHSAGREFTECVETAAQFKRALDAKRGAPTR